jgi:membrane dipeptidase
VKNEEHGRTVNRRDALKVMGMAAAGSASAGLVAGGASIAAPLATPGTPAQTRAGWRPLAGFGDFAFGLTREQEERAAHLHASSIIVDMVADNAGGYSIFDAVPIKAALARLDTAGHGGFDLAGQLGALLPYQEDLAGRAALMQDRWDASGITCGSVHFDLNDLSALAPTLHLIDRLPWYRKATRARDIRMAKQQGAHAFYGYCQPVYGVPRDSRHIEAAFHAGLRCLMLTYNNSDYVGCGCTDRIDHGLTNYGVRVVELCNELGIIIDTSHVGRASTLDACEFSKKPVVANHSAAKALFAYPRAKADDELRAIAKTGGIIGIYAVPFFLSPKPDADINVLLDNIDYVAALVGWQHVGIGSDWPPTAPKSALKQIFSEPVLASLGFRKEHGIDPTRNLVGFDDHRDFPNITRGLVKRGYSDEQIRGILGENFLRVFEQVCG